MSTFDRDPTTLLSTPPVVRPVTSPGCTLLTRIFWVTLGGDEAKLPSDLIARFEQYGWPGNVRELHNAVARHLAIGEDLLFERARAKDVSAATQEDFIDAMLAASGASGGVVPLPIARQQMLQAFEQKYVRRMLELHGGNVSRAAVASGIGRRYFQIIKARG